MTTSPSNIPEAAVEAAAEALTATIAYRINPFMPERYLDGMGVRGIDAAALRKKALVAALEAAAPHMLAAAWEAGWKASSDWSIYIDMGGDEPECDNPYRSQA